MLVLSRKVNEKIVVPELDLVITVLSLGTNRVQLGVQAPQDVQITRPDAGQPRHHSLGRLMRLRDCSDVPVVHEVMFGDGRQQTMRVSPSSVAPSQTTTLRTFVSPTMANTSSQATIKPPTPSLVGTGN